MARKERKNKWGKKTRNSDEKRGFLHSLLVIAGITVLVLVIGVMVVSQFIDHPLLKIPGEIISNVFSPVQKFFSGVTDTVADYFRSLKFSSNLQYEYEQALIKIEELQDKAMLADANKDKLDALTDLMNEENSENKKLDPLLANVIGHDTANYFSVLTLDKGTGSGVEAYMAVVYGGGLVGYTYDVTATTCKVRTIIDSDCTIPALMESTRDQGSVKGTLGIDGQPYCRMYYLPENHLPRAGDTVVTSGVGMEFPKGIPIGVVRESTRGLEDNKQYVVIEPIVDFQHLEYVKIYRYVPSYAETAELSDTDADPTLVPLVTARPQATFAVGVGTSFEEGAATASPSVDPNASPSPTPKFTPTPTPTRDPNATTPPPNLEYVRATPTVNGPTPTPSPTPTPTPAPTFNPDDLTMEDDN